tara:strand:+ start:3267 stop:3860 length:594 start_codon:yes stop_codon:yes gene_type:complete
MDNRTNISLLRNLYKTKNKKKVIEKGPQPNIKELNEGETLIKFVKGELIEYVKFGSKIYEKKYEENLNPAADYKLLPKNLTTKPEYDSGWFDVNDESNYTKTHNLGTKFLIPMIFARETGTTRIWNLNNIGLNEYGSATGINLYMKSDTQIEISTGNTNIFSYDNTTLNSLLTEVTDADIRIFLWRINLTQDNKTTE